jgi:hypothetical protein
MFATIGVVFFWFEIHTNNIFQSVFVGGRGSASVEETLATFWCNTPAHADHDRFASCPANQVCVGKGCNITSTISSLDILHQSFKALPTTTITTTTTTTLTTSSFQWAECLVCCCTAKTGEELAWVQRYHTNCFVHDVELAKANKIPFVVQSGVPIHAMSPGRASTLYDLYMLVDAIATELGPATASQYHFDSGSLIGMVRHHGLIPWDHDGDVCFPKQATDVLVDALCSGGDSSDSYCFDEQHIGTQDWFNSTIHRAIVRSASTRKHPLHPKDVCVICRAGSDFFPFRLYLRGMRMDVFNDLYDECDLTKDGGLTTMYPFYNRTLPGRQNAASYLRHVQYNDKVMEYFVCSEGMTGHAHGVSPPIKLTDFSPAALT